MKRIEIGGRCNNSCWSCPAEGEAINSAELLGAENGSVICGGEPTLRKDFKQVLGKGFVVETNGRAFKYLPLAKLAAKSRTRLMIKLFGHDAKMHDLMTRTKGSFSQMREGVNNLSACGADYGMLICLTSQNMPHSKQMVALAKSLGASHAVIEFPRYTVIAKMNYAKVHPLFSEAAHYIEIALNSDIEVRVRGMPACMLDSRDHIEKVPGEPAKRCHWCRLYGAECDGLPAGYMQEFGDSELGHEYPNEIKIEITDDCNLACGFCYRKGMKGKKKMTVRDRIKLIDGLHGKVNTLRFTGGEPLMSNDIGKLIRRSKQLGFQVIVNTNGTLDAKTLKDADLVLIPLHEPILPDAKMKNIKMLKGKAVINTIASHENVMRFREFEKIIRGLRCRWLWTIPEPVGLKREIDRDDVDALVIELKRFNFGAVVPAGITQAMPFCAASDRMALASLYGEASICGPRRSLYIDAWGQVRHCQLGEPLGDIRKDSLKMIWLAIQDRIKLPDVCENCQTKDACRGGCSHFIIHNKIDPLMPARK